MTERVTAATDPYVQLHNEIVEFYNKYGPSEEDNIVRKQFFAKVK